MRDSQASGEAPLPPPATLGNWFELGSRFTVPDVKGRYQVASVDPVGEVMLPTDRLVAGEPLTGGDREPFDVPLKPAG